MNDKKSKTTSPAVARQSGVAFFLVAFSLAKQEKVASCRATPAKLILYLMLGCAKIR